MIRTAVAVTAPGEGGAERSLFKTFWSDLLVSSVPRFAVRTTLKAPADHFIEIVRASGLRICSMTQLSTTS